MIQEQKIVNKYIPVSYSDGYRIYHEQDIYKMLADYKEFLVDNWDRNKLSEIEWKTEKGHN